MKGENMAFYLVLVLVQDHRKTVSGPFPTRELAATALGSALGSGIFESGSISEDSVVPPVV